MSQNQTTTCEHCGMDVANACGHPATPAPCWTLEQVAKFNATAAWVIRVQFSAAEADASDLSEAIADLCSRHVVDGAVIGMQSEPRDE